MGCLGPGGVAQLVSSCLEYSEPCFCFVLYFGLLFEAGSHYVAQDVLKFTM